MNRYKKGYRVERKIKKMFEKHGWKVIRSGRSLGTADLVAFKDGKAVFLQVKSTKKDVVYYREYLEPFFEGFPFYVVVNFDGRKVIITSPKEKITIQDGMELKRFLELCNNVEKIIFLFDDSGEIPVHRRREDLKYIG